MTTKLNRRERKAQQLLAHYDRCEKLARHLGATNPDGKKISVALFKAERLATGLSEKACNEGMSDELMQEGHRAVRAMVARALGKLPPAFFINGDPRGYALKIDNETPEGKALIEAVKLHTDLGGYGILSSEITGD